MTGRHLQNWLSILFYPDDSLSAVRTGQRLHKGAELARDMMRERGLIERAQMLTEETANVVRRE